MNSWIIVGIIIVVLVAGLFVSEVFAKETSNTGPDTGTSCSSENCIGQCSESCNAWQACGCSNCAAKTGGTCGCGK